MSNVVKMPERDKHYDQASDWIAKFERGFKANEKAEFKSWIASDKKNREVFMYMAQLWDDMDELSRLSDIFPEETIKTDRYEHKYAAMAASVMLMICLGFFVAPWSRDSNESVYETSIGEHSTLNLSDGSQIILNTNSLVRVDYDETHRLVTLERGEININVAHDKMRPLTVRAGNRVVQAVGTAFNIELFDQNKFELIVTDGEVRVGDRSKFDLRLESSTRHASPGSEAIRLVRLSAESLAVSKGEKVVLGKEIDQQVVNVHERDIEASLSWRQGNLTFDGQPLGEAVKEIGRYTSVRFSFASEDLKKVRVAGLFKAGDVSGLLSALDETFAITAEHVGAEEVILSKKP